MKTNNLQQILTKILLLANINKFNIVEFGNAFLTSKEFDQILNHYKEYYFNPYKIFYSFISNKTFVITNNIISNDIVIYIGFIISKYLLRTKESIKRVLKILPIENIINNYDLYHTLSEERVIFLSKYDYNIKMNAIRKQRSKHNLMLHFDNKEKNLFIACRLYKKLFYYPEIDELVYRYDKFAYLLNERMSLVSKNIFSKDDIYNAIHDNSINDVKFNNVNNTLFLFSKQEIIVNEDLKQLLIDKTNCSVPFDKVFIFDNKKIIFSNIEIPTRLFYLDINSIDIKEIEFNYKNRFKISKSKR